MSQIYISVGSNIQRHKSISNGIHSLEKHFSELSISSVYESEAVGFEGNNFYNLVVGAKTDHTITEVVNILKQIERQNGRLHQSEKFSDRTLDLDLLTFDDCVTTTPAQIPRDEITKNAFVLLPLAEIAADQLHPVLQLSYQQLWQQFDQTKQKLWPITFTLTKAS